MSNDVQKIDYKEDNLRLLGTCHAIHILPLTKYTELARLAVDIELNYYAGWSNIDKFQVTQTSFREVLIFCRLFVSFAQTRLESSLNLLWLTSADFDFLSEATATLPL